MEQENKENPGIDESPLRIRAHSLLCLQGYRGLGYSPEFIAEMDRVSEYLGENPETPIKVVAEADIFCEQCPHHYRGRCTADDPEDQPVPFESPDHSVLMDRRVLGWLGISDGEVQVWSVILNKIGQTVDSTVMDILCGECRWREFPYCEQALDELHKKVTEGERLFHME